MDSEPKHTPGLWFCVYAGTGSHVIYDKAKDECVATCRDTYDKEPDETEANARLIAAAPAMYALLRDIELSNWVGPFYECPVCGCQVDDPKRTRGVCVSAHGHERGCRLAAILKEIDDAT
jgi:hypothetical protein